MKFAAKWSIVPTFNVITIVSFIFWNRKLLLMFSDAKIVKVGKRFMLKLHDLVHWMYKSPGYDTQQHGVVRFQCWGSGECGMTSSLSLFPGLLCSLLENWSEYHICYICIYPTPPPPAGCDTRSIFMWSTAGLNSVFLLLESLPGKRTHSIQLWTHSWGG